MKHLKNYVNRAYTVCEEDMSTSHSRGETIFWTTCILFQQEIQPQDHIVHEHYGVKKNLSLTFVVNSVHLFELFPSLIPLWAYRKAQVRCIPGDAKSRHQKDKQHLFTLKNSLAELLPWWRYHTCRLNKAVRCLYHTVIPNLKRVSERIPIKFSLLKSSGHLWLG